MSTGRVSRGMVGPPLGRGVHGLEREEGTERKGEGEREGERGREGGEEERERERKGEREHNVKKRMTCINTLAITNIHL